MRLYELLDNGMQKILNVKPNVVQNNNPTTVNNNANSGINTSNNSVTTNTTINPAITQKLTKGNQIQMPTGPNKQIAKYNITNVDANKNVTLNDVSDPTKPGQVYSSAQLASLINSGNIR